jgi:hypothetical protein
MVPDGSLPCSQKACTGFRSHGNEPPKQSNSEEHYNSTFEGGDLHTVRPEPTSGRGLTNRRQNMTEDRRGEYTEDGVRSQKLSLLFI